MFELKLENKNANVVDINDGDKYVVVSVSGLNPPPASVFSAKSPNRKGTKKNGSTLDERTIVIQIKILGDIEENRNALYAWTDTEQELKVHYRNDRKSVFCEGTVTDCNIDLFTDNEIVNLAVLCNDPYLKGAQEIKADISALLKQFTFPFAINAAGVPFSTLRLDNRTSVYNAGAETGVRITVFCGAEVKNLLIYDASDTTRRFKINYTLPVGWTIVIDTQASPKIVQGISPDGSAINLLRYVESNPTWFTLKKGSNAFGYTAESGLADAEVSIGFRNLYLGV